MVDLSRDSFTSFELRMVHVQGCGHLTCTDKEFTEEDLSKKTKTFRTINEYSKYRFEYLMKQFQKFRARPVKLSKLKTLKSKEYFLSTSTFYERVMFFTPDLFTLGVRTVPEDKHVMISVDKGEMWLYRNMGAPVGEGIVQMDFFDKWDSVKLTKDTSHITYAPSQQYFFVTVEKSLFNMVTTKASMGLTMEPMAPIEDEDEEIFPNSSPQELLISSSTARKRQSDILETAVHKRPASELLKILDNFKNEIEGTSLGDDAVTKQSLYTLQKKIEDEQKKECEIEQQQQQPPRIQLHPAQQFFQYTEAPSLVLDNYVLATANFE